MNPDIKPSIVMMVYGEGGVGKSTFTSTAEKPLMLDFENGSKYFGLRGINMDVLNIRTWADVSAFKAELKAGNLAQYKTIVIDPIGEAMEKLKVAYIQKNINNKKLVNGDGSLAMAGWGEYKAIMKNFVKELRDSGKHIILIGHVTEKEDEGIIVKRPMIETQISTDLRNIVDILGYMFTATHEGVDKRVICVQDNAKFWAKDRTGTLGKFIEPDFKMIADKLSTYKWAKAPVAPVDPAVVETVETPDEEEMQGAVAPTTSTEQVEETKKEASTLLEGALKKPAKVNNEKLLCEIADLEEEIEYEDNNYKVACEHPTKTATFARNLDKARVKLEEKKSKLVELKALVK